MQLAIAHCFVLYTRVALCLISFDIIISSHSFPSCMCFMTNYHQHKKNDSIWHNQPYRIYTGPGGYKMCLIAEAYGAGVYVGTHNSVVYVPHERRT